MLEIPAFFEQVALHQKPDRLEIFNDHTFYSQQPKDIASISSVASSEAMESIGGLSVLHSNIGIYTLDDIAHYLSEIRLQSLLTGCKMK